MATGKTRMIRNVNTIPNINPLTLLFHQVNNLYFLVTAMLGAEGIDVKNITTGPLAATNTITTRSPGRTLTPAARRKIGAYQRKRWAGIKGKTTGTRKVARMPARTAAAA